MNLSLHSHLARTRIAGALAVAAAGFIMSNPQAAPTASAIVVDPSAVTCKLAMPAELQAKQPAVLGITLRNQGASPIYLLRRNTPLEGWQADSLQITRDGKRVAYSGAMAKRTPPTASEYLLLQPGKTHQQSVPLADGYDVTLPGKYLISWGGMVMDLQARSKDINPNALKAVALGCNEVEFIRKP